MESPSTASVLSPTEHMDFPLIEWELLFQTIIGSVRKKSDIVVAFVHCMLVKQCHLLCIGIGTSMTPLPEDVSSELLPAKWNGECSCQYTLRYRQSRNLYFLIGQIKDDCLLLNLMDVKKPQVAKITILPDAVVTQMNDSIRDMIPQHKELYDLLKCELIGPIDSIVLCEITTQTQPSSSEKNEASVLSQSRFDTAKASDTSIQNKEESDISKLNEEEPDISEQKQVSDISKQNEEEPDISEQKQQEPNNQDLSIKTSTTQTNIEKH